MQDRLGIPRRLHDALEYKLAGGLERNPVESGRHVLIARIVGVLPVDNNSAANTFKVTGSDGTTYESDFPAGLTHFYDVGAGAFALHNLENVGDTAMIFCAVELKRESANAPLPV